MHVGDHGNWGALVRFLMRFVETLRVRTLSLQRQMISFSVSDPGLGAPA